MADRRVIKGFDLTEDDLKEVATPEDLRIIRLLILDMAAHLIQLETDAKILRPMIAAAQLSGKILETTAKVHDSLLASVEADRAMREAADRTSH